MTARQWRGAIGALAGAAALHLHPSSLGAQVPNPSDSARVLLVEKHFTRESLGVEVDLLRRTAYWAEVTGPGNLVIRVDLPRGRPAYIVPVGQGGDGQPRTFEVYPLESGLHWMSLSDLPANATTVVRLYVHGTRTPAASATRQPPRAISAPVSKEGMWFGRLEGGTLNPDAPFNVTLAYGVAAGRTWRADAILFHVVRQSRDRNSGADINHARTFLLADWEHSFSAAGATERQPFVRVGAGWLFRSPFKSTWAVDLGAGLKYRLAPRLYLLGTLDDLLARLPDETFTACVQVIQGLPPSCGPARIIPELQHNFGLTVDLEYRP